MVNEEMKKTAEAAELQQNAEAEQLKASEGDFMNTALGKQMVEQLRRQYNDAYKRNVSGGLKQGNTEEQKIAASANINDAYAKGLSNIAAVGTQYRSHVLDRAQALKDAARNRKYGSDMMRLNAENQSALNIADNGAKVGAGMMSAAGSMLSADADLSTKQGWFGGKPQGAATTTGQVVDGTKQPDYKVAKEVRFILF